MMRSTFFAAGLFVALWGAAFLFVDKVQMKMPGDPKPEPGFRGFLTQVAPQPARRKIVDPPDWAAFSLMSLGAVTMLYAVALPRKQDG
ncbi:MAG: hypothetical protein ACE5KM_09165 [Planctomycetaceae bacterium]